MAAIRFLNKRNAPSQDNLNPDRFKADTDIAAKVIQPLFGTIWVEKQLPYD